MFLSVLLILIFPTRPTQNVRILNFRTSNFRTKTFEITFSKTKDIPQKMKTLSIFFDPSGMERRRHENFYCRIFLFPGGNFVNFLQKIMFVAWMNYKLNGVIIVRRQETASRFEMDLVFQVLNDLGSHLEFFDPCQWFKLFTKIKSKTHARQMTTWK